MARTIEVVNSNGETVKIKKNGKRKVKSVSRTITFTVAFCIFAVYAAYILFFLVYALLLTLKTRIGFIKDQGVANLFSFPTSPSLESFALAFKNFNVNGNSFFMMLWHSIWRSLGGTFIGWFACAMVTYILVFYRNKITSFIYYLGFFLSTLPLYGAGPAEYKLFEQIGFINSPLILIQGITLYGGHFFFMYAFWKALSWEYAEAAYVDGAGEYMVFFRIMLPMAIPSMLSLFIMSFIGSWNTYDSTLLYMQNYPNLAYALYDFGFKLESKSSELGGKPTYFAGLLLSVTPALALFLIFQNTIMEKVYLGGLKG